MLGARHLPPGPARAILWAVFDIQDKPERVERALLIAVYFDRREQAETEALLIELAELVDTLGIQVVRQEAVFVREINKRYLTGKGKAHELMELAREEQCDCLVFNNELLPAQQRVWEEESKLCVIDRHEVILDIFNDRAQTSEARIQVELARLEYSLPRLTRMWAHLDRQRGGTGGGKGGGGAARGEGEKQIEVDRRLAHQRIDRLKRELAAVRKQRETQRKERQRTPVPHAAIVGYTNAGKSSLLNRLTGSDVFAADMLFATLDPTTRRVELPDGQTLLMTDTVGFVRSLPHGLVEAFKATLEEALHADFLVHVLDASANDVFAHHRTTMAVLEELGAHDKPVVTVLNKLDLVTDPAHRRELQLHFSDALMVSLKTDEGVDPLVNALTDMLLDRVRRLELRLPMTEMALLAFLHREGKVLSEHYLENGLGVEVTAVLPVRLMSHVEGYVIDDQDPTPASIAPPQAAEAPGATEPAGDEGKARASAAQP